MQPTITNHIEIRVNRRGELRAFVSGSRVRVQDIVNFHERHGMTADEIAREYPQIGLAQVHASLAYYFENQAQIQTAIKADRDFAALIEKQHSSSDCADPDGDTVSS